MKQIQQAQQRLTYGEYRRWPEDERWEKRALYERHGVREYWLVHPLDRLVTRYGWRDGRFQEPSIEAATGTMAVHCLPGLVIDWGFFEPWHEAWSGPEG
ncbi:MAG: Uma2 family endonuclease [Methylococcaceae bacterium]|nr:MAG: Uma2 family endonuclease [Methylococcaceae bacterium]